MTHDGMLALANKYHDDLPPRIREYLRSVRGIPDPSIDFHLLGWNGRRITIPVFNRAGHLAFFKLAKDPEDKGPSPKMIASRGAFAELYNWAELLIKPPYVIICEGEFDQLVLEANIFRAVTSTGGAGTFRPEWAKEFTSIPEVYVCFDRDTAGQKGALRVARMIPHAKIVELPEEVGNGGDVTDFFVRLGRAPGEFAALLQDARPAPPPESRRPSRATRASLRDSNPEHGRRTLRIKNAVPLVEIVTRHVKLRPSGQTLVGLCPFHDDHDPSLHLYPATQTFHCFGCGKHGDVITFVREMEHLTFRQALDVLDELTPTHGDPAPQQP